MQHDKDKIDVSTLDKDGLERLKMILDLQKIQQDLENDRARIQQEIEESRARMEQMRIESEKYRAETEKMRKENVWYPWLQIIITFIAGMLASGAVMFFLNKTTGQ